MKKNKYLCDIRLMIEKLQYLTRQHLESIFFSLLKFINIHLPPRGNRRLVVVVVTYII